MALPEIGLAGQRRLQDSAILVAGLGGLGCAALSYLAASGIGKIGLLDFDRVAPSNLPRQILYSEADIGKYKAQAAYDRLQTQYPRIAFDPLILSVQEADLSAYDLILDATDNSAARYAINDVCQQHKKPWIYGSIHQWQGQVSFFGLKDFDYRDLFPDASSVPLPACAESGVLGPMAGAIGAIQSLEAIKYLATGASDLSGKLLVLDAKNYRMQLYELCSHSHWGIKAQEFEQLRQTSPICLIDAAYPFPIAGLPKDQKIVLYCPRGIRSRSAAERLRQEGFEAYFIDY
jgi:sulfur-carrier protein adenylyltransferase/sulfurtransferase